VAALRTGNGKRDKDLRKSMEVDSFPTMRFDLADVLPTDEQLLSDSTAVMLRGRLTIHGVTHDVDIASQARRQIRLKDGKVLTDERVEKEIPVA